MAINNLVEIKYARTGKSSTTDNAQILVCTHSTLRNAMKDIPNDMLNDVFFGIDEFHHASAGANNYLAN